MHPCSTGTLLSGVFRSTLPEAFSIKASDKSSGTEYQQKPDLGWQSSQRVNAYSGVVGRLATLPRLRYAVPIPVGERIGVTQLSTERFQETDRYTAYLRTTEGRLRAELGWSNLRDFLTGSIAGKRALDVGGGIGTLALPLAALGFEVELLDSSEPMLAFARREVEAQGLSGRISFRHADVNCVSDLFQPSSFHLVVCHNLLEYIADPFRVLRNLAQLLRRDVNSVFSLLVRNRYGEVLKAAIKCRDFELAEAALSAETVVDSLYAQPVRVFDPVEVCNMAEQAGLELLAVRGVRVVADYLGCEALTEDAYRRLRDFELLLGAQPQLAAMARYTQIIARAFSNRGGAK